MTDPRVTVLMTAYNEEETIREAIASVLAQSFRDLELLVVNDGSRDSTPRLVAGVGDPRVRLLSLRENQGRTRALNAGLGEARGTYIAVMDADDWSFPKRLACQVEFLDTGRADIVGVDYIVVDTLRDEIYVRRTPQSHTKIVRSLSTFIPIAHGAVAYRRQAILDLGGYNSRLRDIEDLDLWIRAAAAGLTLANIGEVLHLYRISRRTSKFHSRYSHFRRNLTHTRLNLAAVGRLGLPPHHYALAGLRLIYPLLPPSVRRVVRRAQVAETPLAGEELAMVLSHLDRAGLGQPSGDRERR